MNIWINRELSAYSRLTPQAKEAFVLLATCYEQSVRTVFRSNLFASELDRLPQGTRLEIYIVAAMDKYDWMQKHDKLSSAEFKSLNDKARQQLSKKHDVDIKSSLDEIRQAHPDFNIGIVLGGEIGQSGAQMSEFDLMLVRRQTEHLALNAKSKQT